MKNFDILSDEVTEIARFKTWCREDIPRTLAVFILGYAKLQLLKFAYALMDFCCDSDWSPIVIDTDSLCIEMSVASGNVDDIIKDRLKSEWDKVRHNYFPSSDDHAEQKRHGIFKVEFEGTHIVALSAKSYCVKNENTESSKIASKGISKRLNNLNFELFKKVLFEEHEHIGENRGFKRTKDGKVFLYRQKKVAVSPYYIKRLVDDDNMIETSTIRFTDERLNY